MARAVMCRQLGGPEVLTIEEVPERAPGPGEVAVRVRAASLNFPDVLMVAGGYQFKPDLPFVPGMEAGGDVVAVGDGVAGVTPGDRVIATARCGAFTDHLVVPAAQVIPLPDPFDHAEGAAFPAAFSTAYVSLVPRGGLQQGEVLLVHGAAGGVGMAAVVLGKVLGATVIATARGQAKLDALKAWGADHVIDYTEGFRDQVLALTDGRGADVVFDPVNGPVFEESTRCIAWGGRILVIGFTSGERVSVRTNHILIKGYSVVGVRAGEFGRKNPAAGEKARREMYDLADRGLLKPRISHRLPMEQVVEGMRLLLDRKVIGKAVLTF